MEFNIGLIILLEMQLEKQNIIKNIHYTTHTNISLLLKSADSTQYQFVYKHILML